MIGQKTGSIEIGKQADLIAVNSNTPRMTPLLGGKDGNLHHNIVHAVRGSDVDMTRVDGRILVDEGKLLSGDSQDIISSANLAATDLFKRRKIWLANNATVDSLHD